MNDEYTKELRDIKLASKHLEEYLKSFEEGIKSVFYEHFFFLNSIAYYIFYKEDSEYLESKLGFHMEMFSMTCAVYSKFIVFTKFSLLQSQENDSELNEKMEFILHHNKFEAILDRSEMHKFTKIVSKHGWGVKFKPSFTTETNKDFEKLKKDVKDLNEKSNKDLVDPSELKSTLDKLMESFEHYKIKDHYKYLKFHSDAVHEKHVNYSNKYYHKCVLKQQTSFVYEKIWNKKTCCAVCLEELKDGANVTKLKCGHLYCTSCIEKWLSSSITCPYCRQSPEGP